MGQVDVLQGTLDLMILKSLTWGPFHGYGVMAWLRERTGDELRIEDAAIYPALHRLESRGFVESEWGVSENNRRAKFYRLSAAGRRQLIADTDGWLRYVGLMANVLAAPAGPGRER